MGDAPKLLKRQSSASKRPPTIKRQRIKVQKFEIDATPSKKRKSSTPRELLYSKGTFLAVRAGNGVFYICQAFQDVFDTHTTFKIRWLEEDSVPNIYRYAYEDRTDQNCVIAEVTLRRQAKGQLRLVDGEQPRIIKLLKAAEDGTDVNTVDLGLFQPITTKRKKTDDDDESAASPVQKKTKKEENKVKNSKPAKAKVVAEKEQKATPLKKARTSNASITAPVLSKAKTTLTKTPSLSKKGSLKKVVSMPAALQKKPSLKKTPSKTKAEPAKKKRQRKPPGEKKERKKKEPKEKKVRQKKPPKPKVDRTDPNRKLVPNPNVPVWEKNPLYESRETVPFVSTVMHSKLLFRAVALKDKKMLQTLIADKKQVHSLNDNMSCHNMDTPLIMATKKEDHDAIRLLAAELYGDGKNRHARAPGTHSLLQSESTGRYNPRSLGIKAIRKVQIARGGKEGNNALTKDLRTSASDGLQTLAIRSNISMKTIDLLNASKVSTNWNWYEVIYEAVRCGNRKLAAKLIEESNKIGGVGFNKLHIEALKFDNENWADPLREASVTKKPNDNKKILPIHCAAINPNKKYLNQFLAVVPEYNIQDDEKRRPIHYAAACEGTGPLEVLISKGVSLEEGDKNDITPLHIACQMGRAKNVRLLLEKIHAQLESTLSPDADGKDTAAPAVKKPKSPFKFGKGNVNKPIKKTGWCPIHFAVTGGHKDVIEVLLEYGADINKNMNASNNKITPLIMAAQDGNMDMVKFLIQHKAKIEKPDKLSRTALVHAVRDGHAHVASYLLALGANPNVADSSGNTAFHYAAAFGWYFCLKTLMDAGANPDAPNDWKLTPLGASYMKGNRGLTQIIIDLPGVNINFQDESGNSILMSSMKFRPFTDDIYNQIYDMIVNKKADVTLQNKAEKNALHILVEESVRYTRDIQTLGPGLDELLPEPLVKVVKFTSLAICKVVAWAFPTWGTVAEVETYLNTSDRKVDRALAVKTAKLLIEQGCDPNAKLSSGQTPVFFALNIESRCWYVDLIKLLLEEAGLPDHLVDTTKEQPLKGTTILHLLANCIKMSDGEKTIKTLADMLDLMLKMKTPSGEVGVKALSRLARVRNPQDSTPFFDICRKYVVFSEYPTNGAWNQMQRIFKVFLEDLKSELDYSVEKKRPDPKNPGKEIAYQEVFITASTLLQKHDHQINKQNKYRAFPFLLKYKPNLDIRVTNGRTLLMENLRNYSVVEALINAGADVNRRSKMEKDGKMSPLLLAIKESDAGVVKLLLRSGANIKDKNLDTAETALHILIRRQSISGEDYVKFIEYLLDKGVELNAADKRGLTVLHLVADQSTDSADESKDAEKLLIKKGADPFAKSKTGRLPLHYIFGKSNKNTNSKRSDPVESLSIFASAMRFQKLDIHDKRGLTPLHLAACRGATVCCMILVQKGCDINALTKIANNPLALAVNGTHDSCSLTLMQKGANVNSHVITNPFANKEKPKIIHQEWEDYLSEDDLEEEKTKQTNIKENEYDDNEDSDYDEDDDDGSDYEDSDSLSDDSQPFASQLKRVPSAGTQMKQTLAKQIEDIKKKPILKWKSCHYPVPKQPEESGHPIFQGIVQNGWQGLTYVAMDLLEPFGMDYASAVEIALRLQKYRFALSLMEKQMDLSKLQTKNKDKQNLLHIVCETDVGNGQVDLKKKIWAMLTDDVDLNMNVKDGHGMTCLHYAAWNHNADLIQYILGCQNLDASVKDAYGRTALATMFWNLGSQYVGDKGLVLKEFEKAGAKFDELYDYPPLDMFRGGFQPDIHLEYKTAYYKEYKHRSSPLIVAVCQQQYKVIKAIMQSRVAANLNFRDEKGMTAAMYAARLKDAVALRILMTKFGDINLEKAKEEGSKATKLTSDLDLTAKDKSGFTVLHHLACALPYGVYEDDKIVKLMVNAGAPLQERDKNGKTALDHAIERGGKGLAKALQSLLQSLWSKISQMSVSVKDPVVDDGMDWADEVPDYESDAANYLIEKEKEAEAKIVDEPRAVPDSRVKMEDGEVVIDEDLDMPYDILMTKVDVKIGQYGIYNFYKMQVLCDKAKGLVLLFTCWGRIGDEGMFQRTPFGTVKEAVQEFCNVFKAKSGNEWQNVKSFEVNPKKYRLVDADHRRHNKIPEVVFNLEDSPVKSQLPPYIQDMMKELSNVRMLRHSVRATGVDVPFGCLKRTTLQKAHKLLLKMMPLAEEKDKLRWVTAENIDKFKELSDELAILTTEYYYLVPQKGYELERLPVLDNMNSIRQHGEKLLNLLELERAGSILLGAEYMAKEVNPLDYIYRALRVQLEMMDEDDDEAKVIMKYIYKTANVEVEAIYRVARHGEQDRLNDCGIDNHRLLWHGSSTSNLISILSKGLLIAPKEAPMHGYAYGKGVYTADCFEKSHGYCHNDGGGSTNYMLLCEVALGKVCDLKQTEYMEKAKSGYHSTRGLGMSEPDHAYDARLPSGAVLPLGEMVQIKRNENDRWRYYYGQHHEYIVYNEAQVGLRYIVQFR